MPLSSAPCPRPLVCRRQWHWRQQTLWYSWRRPCRISPICAPWMASPSTYPSILVSTWNTSCSKWCGHGCTLSLVLFRSIFDLTNLRILRTGRRSTRCSITLWWSASLEGLHWWRVVWLRSARWLQGHHPATSTWGSGYSFTSYCHNGRHRWSLDPLGDLSWFTAIN